MILSHQEGPIAVVTLNRPHLLNTLNHEMIHLLTEEIRRWSAAPEIRVLILTGTGRAFAGGVDVRAMAGLDMDGAERFITDLHLCFQEIRQAEKIVIASINGYTLGGGLELAASCDLRVSAEDARFGMPEVRVGIPSVIEAAYLPRLVGLGRAAELVYTGEMIDAREAWRIGLVNQVVPAEKLDAATRELAQKILRNGPTAMVLQKRLVAQWMELHLSASIEAGIRAFRDCFRTGEPREGMKAFLEKRAPEYKK